jgi:hypothetical protein
MTEDGQELDAVMEAVRDSGNVEQVSRKELRQVIYNTVGYNVRRADNIERRLLEGRRLGVINQYAYRVMPDGQAALGDFS